jgi:phosphoenolpyruvate carboxylase
VAAALLCWPWGEAGSSRRLPPPTHRLPPPPCRSYTASNWGLYTAQSALVAVFQRYKVQLRFFHGRGGTVGRGGGPSYDALLSQAEGAVAGGMRLTEQGEVIGWKYADPVRAKVHLEHLIAGAWDFRLGQRGTCGAAA